MSNDADTDLAERIAEAAQRSGRTVAVTESLTGGLVASKLAAAPKASEWFRGGIVAYASEVKYDLLGVPRGPVVSEPAARAMVAGAAKLLGADVTLALTGVGGPDPQDDQPPGTVWFAIMAAGGEPEPQCRRLDGDDAGQICGRSATVALRLLLDAVTADGKPPGKMRS